MMSNLGCFVLRCDYRGETGGEKCAKSFGGDRPGEARAELRTRAKKVGWATGNPGWHRREHGPGHRVDVCPTHRHAPDVQDVRPKPTPPRKRQRAKAAR